MVKKINHTTFEYHPEFKGEVQITKGDQSLKISMEELRAFVAESVRYELADHIQKMKPVDLLRRIA